MAPSQVTKMSLTTLHICEGLSTQLVLNMCYAVPAWSLHLNSVLNLHLRPTCKFAYSVCVKLLYMQTNKPDVKTLVLVSFQLLMFCLQFLLWEYQTASNVYMTTHPKLGLQCNSFPGSTNRLAINQVRIH